MADVQNPLISVIVPIYKVEEYLPRCLESIIAQTYKNMEVILVDDGSPDSCGDICESYSSKYPFIKVIHQENQGVSAARNNAVPVSTGEYITFIDPDDFVTSDYLRYLIDLIKEYNTQIAVGGFVYQYENKPISESSAEAERGFYNTAQALSKMNYGQGFGAVAWGKLYERKLIEDNPFPVGKKYEDLATLYKIIGQSSGIAFGGKKIYYWVQREGSFMHSTFDERQFDGIEAAEAQLKYTEEKYPDALPSAKYRYTAKAVELAGICVITGSDKAYYKKLQRCMLIYSNEVLADPNAKKTMKLRIRAMKLGYLPAKIAFTLHEKAKERKFS